MLYNQFKMKKAFLITSNKLQSIWWAPFSKSEQLGLPCLPCVCGHVIELQQHVEHQHQRDPISMAVGIGA